MGKNFQIEEVAEVIEEVMLVPARVPWVPVGS